MQINNKPDDLISTFTGAPQAADTMRRSQLQRLSEFSSRERAAQDIERMRLEAKYGADSPQAKAAAARLNLLDQERAGIEAEIVRQAIPAPETSPDKFVVYGRVLNSAGESLRRLTVSAVDRNRTNLASTTTRDLGVFEIRVPLGKSSSVPREGRAATEKQEDSATLSVKFQLQISERRSGLLFKNDEVFQAVGDRLTYREIIVPEGASHKRPTSKPRRRSSRKA